MVTKEKLDPDRVVAVLKETSGLVYLAADKLNVSARTVYRYAERYAAVREVLEHQKGKRLDTAEGALWKAVLNGEAWAVCFYLKTQGKARGYVERQETKNVDSESIDRAIKDELARVARGGKTGDAPSPPGDPGSQ